MRYNSRPFRWTSYAFITSDIITFLVQSAGGALFSSDNYNIVVAGGKILVAGLSLQLASVVGFCMWMGRFDYILFREHKGLGEEYEKEWYRIRIARWISITGIFVQYPLSSLTRGSGNLSYSGICARGTGLSIDS